MKATLEEGAREASRLRCAVTGGGGESITDIGEEPFLAAPVLEIDRGAVLAGRYQIERIIGKGGSGLVLRAFDRFAEQPVAVKILKPELAANPHWVERFSRELRLARQIQHPNVCRVFDIGEADGHKFLTMELGSDTTLRTNVRPCALVRPMAERIADARALVSGMAAIHAAGIVHRDIKPENMLRMEDGRLVVSDFGLATNALHTPAVTCMVGTPSYMAPEMVMGDPADLRSDVWAIGVVMHEILFGKRPEWDVNRGERTFKSPVAKDAPPVVRALARLCADCASESPASRPADAMEVTRRFEHAADPKSHGFRQRLWENRRRWGWAPLAAAAVAALVITKDRGWRMAAASSATMTGTAMSEVIKPQGTPTDWSKTSTLLSRIDGHVHCVSMLPDKKTARVIWGSPRRAEDIDLATGERRVSTLRPETYQRGCPSIAPRGNGILYEWADGSSASQIMFSSAPDGSNARALIKGTDPIWVPSGQEFVFEMDQAHAALFSLPTMAFNLILDEGMVGKKAVIFKKAVSASGDMAAILYIDDNGGPGTLVTHSLPGLEVVRRFHLPDSTKDVMFDPESGDLRFPFENSSLDSGIARLDLHSGASRREAFLPHFDIRSLLGTGEQRLLLSRRLSSDVWIVEQDGTRTRVTSNGESYSAASVGDLALVGTRAPDGRYVIVKYESGGGQGTPISAGPLDMMPALTSDKSSWFYVSYETNGIFRCESSSQQCRQIHIDPLMPAWPSPSPDGRELAYVTQLGQLRVRVVPSVGGTPIDLGPALSCGPVWATSNRLWSFQVAGGGRAWVEIDVRTGEKTGQALPVPTTDSSASDRDSCLREMARPGSPLFNRTRVEPVEISELRSLRI